MAKRKRLTPARPDFLATPSPEPSAAGLETKAFTVRPPGPPPIASVAGETSAAAALTELTESMARARAEGRLVLTLDTEEVDAGYLMRDRMAADEEEMQVLMQSISARGQQTPIEVAETGDGYGLISGWRRLEALRRLARETGDPRFSTVLALLRRPDEASEAYRAMVEENEIRVGLSYFERARIVVRAALRGVYPDLDTALADLFASASRAKRSKIRSFTMLVELEGALRFPQAIPERLGLALVRALGEDPDLARRVDRELRARPAETVDAELAYLSALVTPTSGNRPSGSRPAAPDVSPAPQEDHPPQDNAPGETPPMIRPGESRVLAPGVTLRVSRTGRMMTLEGPGLDAAFHSRLLAAFGN